MDVEAFIEAQKKEIRSEVLERLTTIVAATSFALIALKLEEGFVDEYFAKIEQNLISKIDMDESPDNFLADALTGRSFEERKSETEDVIRGAIESFKDVIKRQMETFERLGQ